MRAYVDEEDMMFDVGEALASAMFRLDHVVDCAAILSKGRYIIGSPIVDY
jgi:hypothetical protein